MIGSLPSASAEPARSPASVTPGRISGKVVDPSGRPVPGAAVHSALSRDVVRSDAAGTFVIENVPPLSRGVIAAKEGYSFTEVPIDETVRIVIYPETPETAPRTEYPRPDRDRRPFTDGAWAPLTGTWSFDFDPDGVGVEQRWFSPRHDFTRAIRVPFPVQSLAAFGEESRATDSMWINQFRGVSGALWYRRSFTVPAPFAGHRTRLRIAAADWGASVWLDGEKLAGDQGTGYGEIAVDLGELEPGSTHQLTIRVVAPPADNTSPYPMGKQRMGSFEDIGGIWQPVWIEPVDRVQIDGLRVIPQITFPAGSTIPDEASISVQLSVIAAPDGSTATLELTDPAGRTVTRETMEVRDGGGRIAFAVPDPQLWSPDDPNLYQLSVSVDAGQEGRDGALVQVGLRTFDRGWAPGHSPDDTDDPSQQYQYFYLNNRPHFVRGVLDQGYNPWGIYAYTGVYQGPDFITGSEGDPQPGSIRFDLEAAKRLGFTMIRLHLKISDPAYYHLADQLGLLIWYDLPNNPFDALTEAAHQRWEAVMREAIARDANHPSIVTWVAFNEGWGIGGGGPLDPDSFPWVLKMVDLIKELDPTRLVVDNSPTVVQGHLETDINDFHWYSSLRPEWKDLLDDQNAQVYPGSQWNFYPSYSQSGQPWMNSEFGSGLNNFGMHIGLFRSYPKMAGYVYTQLTDQEHERGKSFTYSRLPNESGFVDQRGHDRGIELFNRDVAICLDSNPAIRAEPGDQVTIRVSISHFSPRDLAGSKLSWKIVGTDALGVEQRTKVHGSRTVSPARYDVSDVGAIEVTMPTNLRVARLHVWLSKGRATVAETYLVIDLSAGTRPAGIKGSTIFDVASPTAQSWTGGLHEVVDGSGTVGMITGIGAGWFEYLVEVPETCRNGKDLTLVVEAATFSRMPTELEGGSQALQMQPARSSVTRGSAPNPGLVELTVDGTVVGSVLLPDDPMDARGRVGAWRDPGQIRYGAVAPITIPGSAVRDKESVRLRLSSRAGLALFGPGTGRFGIDAQLVPGAHAARPPSTRRPVGLPGFADRPTVTVAAPDLGRASTGVAVVTVVNPSRQAMRDVMVALYATESRPATPIDEPELTMLRPGQSWRIRFGVEAADRGTGQELRLSAVVDATAGSPPHRVSNRVDVSAKIGGELDETTFPRTNVDDDFSTDTSGNYDLWLPYPDREAMPTVSFGSGELSASGEPPYFVVAAHRSEMIGDRTFTALEIKKFIVPRVAQDVFFVGLARDEDDYVMAWMGYDMMTCGIDVRVSGQHEGNPFPIRPAPQPGNRMALVTEGTDVSLWLDRGTGWTPVGGLDVGYRLNFADPGTLQRYRHAAGLRGEGGKLAISRFTGRTG
ncbi:sugar-binding domain-containing protein [Jiangella asiatica]|uniref:sugar-binding domain-containing protein n=1 Tax=Jiangella asiatica TaxID=2530372 RepID=UPI0013A5E398|nr:sugar-binding domain-containing protein [Jiangella asiatica]